MTDSGESVGLEATRDVAHEQDAGSAAPSGTRSPATRRHRSAARLRRHWRLLVALLVVLVGRIALYDWAVSPDESGFFLVADDLLEHGGEGIYGHYFVDRPPVLIWIFSLGAALGDVHTMRWLVAAFLAAFVVLGYLTVRHLGGSAGWAAAVAAAFAITPEVGAQVANGEAFAIPFVMACILCTVFAEQARGRTALAWSATAGFVGLLAMGVKQNFADGLVFAFVLLVASGLRGDRQWGDVVRRLGAGMAGILAGVGVIAAYAATTGAGVSGMWLAAVTFRGDATEIIRSGDRTAIVERQEAIIESAWVAGIIPLVAVLLVIALASRFRGSALSWAVAATITVEVMGIVIGGNFWSHYLMGMAPGLVLAAGLWGRRWLVAAASAYLVVSALVVMPVKAIELADKGTPVLEQVGTFVADSAEPGDTATTLFGRSDAQRATGLRSPYRHLWSLPIRVLDPDLEELTALVESDRAPTFVIQVFPLDSWGLDPDGRFAAAFEERYQLVHDGCHANVYLRRDVERDLADDRPPTC